MKIIKNIVTCVLFIFFMTSCSNSVDKARIAYLEEQIEELKSSQNNSQNETTTYLNNNENQTNIDNSKPSNYGNAGTYEVIDKFEKKWIIILNEDETVRIQPDGSDVIGYGSWKKFRDGQIWINMDEKPRIVFPNLEEGFFGHGVIYENFLYRTTDSAKSKNPNQRLQIKKLK